MQASIIIVSFNARNHIAQCLRALRQYTQNITYEVIVSDNGSTDGTVDMIRAEFPWVVCIENKKNLGFGAANNQAVKYASGEMLFFFNDDTVLIENSVSIAYAYMYAHPEIGCMGFHLLFPDHSHQDSVRALPHRTDQLLILLKIHHVLPNLAPLRRYICRDFDYTLTQEVEQVMGACMVIPRTVFQEVQGFDERFFIWFEEVDLQKRIREIIKKKVVYAPITQMIHTKGATFGKNTSTHNQRYFNQSMRSYFHKHGSRLDVLLITSCAYIALFFAYLIQRAKYFSVFFRKKRSTQF